MTEWITVKLDDLRMSNFDFGIVCEEVEAKGKSERLNALREALEVVI